MIKSQTNSTSGTSNKKITTSQNGSALKNKSSKSLKEKSTKTLEDLFEDELKDIYNAEQQLLKALPEMVEASYSEDLQNAFNKHLEQTKRHVERIEKIFTRLRIDKDDENNCEAMEGLIKESKEIIEKFEKSPVRDSALIIGAQKIEHYEIASYGSLCELADVLGYSKVVEILDRTLEEEEMTDKNLTHIAQDVNDEAYELSHEEEFV